MRLTHDRDHFEQAVLVPAVRAVPTMSAPLPGDPAPRTERPDPRHQLAREWASAVSTTAYVPMAPAEIERHLLRLVHTLLDATLATPFRADAAEQVGVELVRSHFTGLQSLQRTIQVLGRALPVYQELRRLNGLTEKVLAVLGALSAGYVRALRALTFEQQEEVKVALLRARQDVEQRLRLSEERFRGVFASTAVGIAISDLDGRFIETNAALSSILGYDEDQFAERTVFDLVHADEATTLRNTYRELAETGNENFRLQRRLICADGDTAWVFLAVSLLRDGNGKPVNYVTVVEDMSDVYLTQEQMSRQALHDALTGLPNHQFFTTRSQSMLSQLPPTEMITLFHLNIDSFSVINDGFGRYVGDQMLKVVTNRLHDLFGQTPAMIARIGGDEFAVLIADGDTPVDVPAIAARINEELSEPAYIDGKGLAVTMGIGVVRRQVYGAEPAELLRQSHSTLRRVKANGKRQWAAYDSHLDARDRDRFTLAATMPGALENGEFRLLFQPQVRLADQQVVAVDTLVAWDHPERGELDHAQCVALAEQTGIVLSLGEWVLAEAAGHAADWVRQFGDAAPMLSVELISPQANDPDLALVVRTVLEGSGLAPDRLQIGIPVRALLCEDGDAEDNVKVLSDMGVRVVLTGFGGGHGGLAFLEDLPVRAVKIAGWLVNRVATRPDSVSARAVEDMAGLVHACGASVMANLVSSAEQASWWQQIGADTGQGDFLATSCAADEIIDRLSVPDGPSASA